MPQNRLISLTKGPRSTQKDKGKQCICKKLGRPLQVSWDWLLRHDRPLLEAANRLAELGYIMLSGGHFKFASTCHLQYYMWRTLGQNIQAVANLPNDIFGMLKMAIPRLDPNVLFRTLSRSRNGNAYENLFHLELWRYCPDLQAGKLVPVSVQGVSCRNGSRQHKPDPAAIH